MTEKPTRSGESDDRMVESEVPPATPMAAAPEATPDGSGPPREKTGKKSKKKDGGKGKGKKKDGGLGRGVETMFRTTYRTHLDLSSIADNKANIMISINGIIISILLATIYPSIVQERSLLFPSTLLLLGCLTSLVLAVLAARPRVTRKTATLEDVRENRANILFFGTFTTMKEEDFLSGMWELMGDRERTYTNMMRDLYGLGAVLAVKYRLLRLSYTVFMIGLAVGVVSFLAVYATAGEVGAGF